ncbi:MAG: thiamine diphosphokinase [Lachnospiraceae bacterium]|nr:thiamine diphosphokinase [Lachnospiraceae bacterium]
MRRCVIVGGADIIRYDIMRRQLRDDDYIIYCDCGLKHMKELNRTADLVVGDFDTYQGELPDSEIVRLPREKDDTDTFFAAKEAVRRGFDEFLLLGTIGGRLDHTFANLSILLMLDNLGKKAKAVDDYSEIWLLSKGTAYIDDDCKYFSTLNLSGTAEGIIIKNAKYPLDNGKIEWDFQYGISNEVLPGKRAEVSLKKGRLLIVKQFTDC